MILLITYLLSFLLIGTTLGQDISFGEETIEECTTVGGPQGGQPCQFPFKFGGKIITGCTTEADPDNKYWCSTKVDSGGNHINLEDNWGYCSDTCKKDKSDKINLPETVETPSSGRQFSDDIEGGACTTSLGALGVCRLPSSCIGVTISFLEENECTLGNKKTGVCCLDITENNIVNIEENKNVNLHIDIPDISIQEADVFLRFGKVDQGSEKVKPILFQATGAVGGGVNFGGEEGDIGEEEEEEDTPENFHLRFNTPRKESLSVDFESEALLDATKRIQEDNNLTDIQATIGLRAGFNSDTSAEIDQRCPWTPAPTCNPNLFFRTFDGTCNNLQEPNFGRTGTPYQRILLPDYAPGTVDQPRRRRDNFELPSAREVSNALAGEAISLDSDNTVLVMQMGQFLDHDITHTPNHGVQCCDKGGQFPKSFDAKKCFPIRMFEDDRFWRGRKTCMSFARSLSAPSLNCGLQSREQLNQITHWIDGSNIYGSTVEEAMHLRSARGRMKVSPQSGTRFGNLPSCAAEQAGKVTGCDVCGGRKNECFFAGDFRVNEQLNLVVMHTIFMREHNRIATALEQLNPRWSDDRIYQEARRINIAEYQHILYKEWLPIIIGNTFMQSYGLFPLSSGYSMDYADNFDPRINNEFATAAFRFGHSLIPRTYFSRNRGKTARSFNVREIFFKPKEISTAGSLDGLLRGMTENGGALWDANFVPDIKDHLFEASPGSGGLDLVAVNIQRGRDHGLPGYIKYRDICLGLNTQTWDNLTSSFDGETISRLQRVYKEVEDIDLYAGGFLEPAHEDSILGPVFKCIIGDQFARLKKGDRFFYDLGVDDKVAFTPPQLEQIRKTSMARLICDNTDDFDSLQPLAFKLSTEKANKVVPCSGDSIPRVNLAVFKE